MQGLNSIIRTWCQVEDLQREASFSAGCDETADYARTDIVKLIWEYIKANDLQDPKNKKKILPDEKLKLIFTFPLDMFTMNKQLSKHLKPSGSVISSGDAAPPKKKAKKKEAPENGEKKKSGFAAPLQLSEPLAELVGQQAASRGMLESVSETLHDQGLIHLCSALCIPALCMYLIQVGLMYFFLQRVMQSTYTSLNLMCRRGYEGSMGLH